MTVTVDDAPEDTPAGWWARAGAFCIDVLFGLGVLATVLMIGLSAPAQGWLYWLCMVLAGAVLLAVLLNRSLFPAATGWSLGRSIFGIVVVRRDGTPVGPWRLLVRDLAHLIDTAPLCLGWLWPLIDSRGRTFADLLCGTEVRQAEGAIPDRRRLVERLVAGAAALSVVIAGLGYGFVYRQQRASAQTRAQISIEGPKIVSDMLSYTVKTASDDFAKAQSLVTDGYRPELTQQQQSVRKIGLVDNDYWATNSAVISAAADRATMLMLLQGQRGIPPNQRFIIASVRVSFEKVSGGQWLVSELTVLSPPKPTAPTPPAPAPPAPAPGKPAAPAPSAPAPAKPGAGR
ncbi:MAG: RDD family protein [Mycobacterium sp.]